MKLMYFFWVGMLVHLGCSAQEPPSPTTVTKISESHSIGHVASYEDVLVGAERMDILMPMLADQRVGLVVNHTAMVGQVHLVDTLQSAGIDIKRIFAPEHGFRGAASAGEKVIDGVDLDSRLPIKSLYGQHRRPTAEWLADLDLIIFDIQDVGARFYTYITTMHYVMEACAEHEVSMVILDRPNPNGFYFDGPVLDTAFRSFVGWHPIPVVHGLTVGELATMIVGEGWLRGDSVLDLQVIDMVGYDPQATYDLPIPPSPNLPTHRSILLYPSLCLFEGTVFSVGRGTDHPFEVLGHPDYDEGDYSFTPSPNEGARSPKHQGVMCRGFDYSMLDLDSLSRRGTLWMQPWGYISGREDWIERPKFFDLLMGTDSVRKQLTAGVPLNSIRDSWQPSLDRYGMMRQRYLRY